MTCDCPGDGPASFNAEATRQGVRVTSCDPIYQFDAGQLRRRIDETAEGVLEQTEGRYVDAALPELPFADEAFDLALSSHFLFLYTSQLGDDFHHRALREMCRVAREVRIFPLLALGGAPSPLVDVAARELAAEGFTVSIDPVPDEFQRGANRMLRIRRAGHQPHA